jgi:hypothetical protein
VFDLETKTVDADDVQGTERQVRTHQQDRSSGWMNNGYEAHKPSNRPPHQVAHAIPDFDALFAIDIDDTRADRDEA